MSRLWHLVSLFAVTAILVSCAPARQATPAASPSLVRFSILAADDHGAIVYDSQDSSYRGWSRNGAVSWTRDSAQIGARAQVSCAGQCPDAIFSSGDAQAGSPPPLYVGGKGSSHTVTAPAGVVYVVAARSATEFTAIIDQGGSATLASVRDGRTATVLDLPGPDVEWFENREGTRAIVLAPSKQSNGGKLLQLTKNDEGWRLLAVRDEQAMPVGACLADGPAVLLGQKNTLLLPGGDTPLRTNLSDAAECVIGPMGGVLVRHTIDNQQRRSTAIRGFDFHGAQSWSRDVGAEVLVTADPIRPRYLLSYPDHSEIVDDTGTTVLSREGNSAAMFTSSGTLVTVDNNKKLAWSADLAAK